MRDIRGEDAVFTPSQSARERKAVVGDGQNSAEELCYGCAAILQVLWTAADVVGDFETLAEEGDTQRPEQEGIIDYFDILCPLAENILLLPGRSNELIFNGLPTNVQYKGLIAPSVLTAIVVPCMKIAQKAKLLPGTGTEDDDVIQYYEQAPAQPNPVAQYYGPVVSMIAALANTVMASYYGDKNGTSKGAIAESILCTVFGNLSNVAAPLTTWWLNASLEDVPVAVKIIIDGVSGLSAGTIYAVQAWED